MTHIPALLRDAVNSASPTGSARPTAYRFDERSSAPARVQRDRTTKTGPLSAANLSLLLRDRMHELITDLTGSTPRVNARGCVRLRRRGSLAIYAQGPKRGLWYDFEAGVGGDPLGLVAYVHRSSVADALSWSRRWLGHSAGLLAGQRHPSAPPIYTGESRRTRPSFPNWSEEMAIALWRSGRSPAGTAAEAYLKSRGLSLPVDAPLRFAPVAWRNPNNGPPGPAMLAQLTRPETNEPVGIHVTYLRDDGSGKADGPGQKVILGRTGVVRLVPDEEVTVGLGLAEGIETSLAIMQRIGWRPVWAATSAGAIARFSVLSGIEALTLFADPDHAGIGAARVCASRWSEEGREVRIIRPPTGDWDDATRGRAA